MTALGHFLPSGGSPATATFCSEADIRDAQWNVAEVPTTEIIDNSFARFFFAKRATIEISGERSTAQWYELTTDS